MGTVSTDRVIGAPLTIENNGAPGTFGLVSRDTTQPILVDLFGERGGERIELVNPGDSFSISMLGVRQIVVSAERYPTRALINWTTLDIALAAAPSLSASSITPVHFDLTTAAAGTYTLWTPSSGTRFVLTSWYIAVGGAGGRVALIDGTDIAGRRIVDHPAAAAGSTISGSVGYTSVGVNLPLLFIVSTTSGVAFVAVTGFVSS